MGSSTFGAAVFLLIRVVSGWLLRTEALGWGDVILMAFIGAFLGVRGLLPVVLIGSMSGVLVGSVALLVRSGPAQPQVEHEDGWTPPRTAVPFGPFLLLAAVVWLLFEQPLLVGFRGFSLWVVGLLGR